MGRLSRLLAEVTTGVGEAVKLASGARLCRRDLAAAGSVGFWMMCLVLVDATLRARDPFAALRGVVDLQLVVKYAAYVIAGWAGITALVYSGGERLRACLRGSPTRLVLAYAVLAIVSVSYAPNPFVSLAWALQLGVFIAVTLWLVSNHRTDCILLHIEWALKFVALVYVAMLVVAKGLVYRPLGYYGEVRLGGFYHPNAVAVLAVTLVAIILARRCFGGPQRRADLLFLMLGAAAVPLTGSRMGMASLAIVVGVIYFQWLKHRTRRAMVWLPVAIIALCLLVLNWDEIYRGLLRRQADVEFYTFTGRIYLWAASLEFVEGLRIVWGHGYGASRVILLQEFAGRPLLQHTNLQNGPLEGLFNLGVLGIGLLAATYVVSYRALRRRIVESGIAWPEAARLSLLLILALNAVTEISFFGAPNVQLLLFVFVAISTARDLAGRAETASASVAMARPGLSDSAAGAPKSSGS